jgi:hypothetical protein
VTPFEITVGSTTTLTFPIYTIAPRSRSYAVSARMTRGATVARIEGDRLEIPNPITVRILVDEPTLSDAYVTAYSTIATANMATEITSYEGTVFVDGILSASIEIESPHLFLTLVFAPTGAT